MNNKCESEETFLPEEIIMSMSSVLESCRKNRTPQISPSLLTKLAGIDTWQIVTNHTRKEEHTVSTFSHHLLPALQCVVA
jgi:hypothetical protein